LFCSCQNSLLVCLDSGNYDIFVGGKKYGVYKDSGSFGELALMYNQPRAATITATSPGTLWAMVTVYLQSEIMWNCCKISKATEDWTSHEFVRVFEMKAVHTKSDRMLNIVSKCILLCN